MFEALTFVEACELQKKLSAASFMTMLKLDNPELTREMRSLWGMAWNQCDKVRPNV